MRSFPVTGVFAEMKSLRTVWAVGMSFSLRKSCLSCARESSWYSRWTSKGLSAWRSSLLLPMFLVE